MSEHDRRLLKLIEQDCRLTPQELAIQTGLTVEYITFIFTS
ncbi:MAG: winged helix-turn-helix transcriptional regulator [Desulfitobacteriaceae bacterium]